MPKLLLKILATAEYEIIDILSWLINTQFQMKFSNNLHFVINTINELSSKDSVEVMKLRSEVFVEEQNCVYLDPDIQDFDAYHLRVLNTENKLLAYSRIYQDEGWHIGRIATNKAARNQGIGKAMVAQAISFCRSKDPSLPIEMSAQVYLTDFYGSLGFQPVGPMYLEDGIPHIKMRYQD